MKPRILSMAVVVLTLLFSTTLFARGNHQEQDWSAFGKNLSKALTDKNEGVQLSALQQIIRFHDRLDMKDAAINILHIYRSNADLQTRRLALTALSKTNSGLALGYLKRAYEFEKSPVLKKQILFILKNAEEPLDTAAVTKSAADSKIVG